MDPVILHRSPGPPGLFGLVACEMKSSTIATASLSLWQMKLSKDCLVL